MSTFKYGSIELDSATLPASSIDAMIRRGIAHFFGNEVAAKVTGAAEKYVKENTKEGESAPIVTDDQRAAWKADFQKQAYDALLAGEVGMSVRGPRVDPLESTINSIATREVKDMLAAAKIKAPKAGDKIKFSDGAEFTMADLVARRLAKEGDRITKEANKVLADRKRKADAAVKVAATAEAKTADALGL